MSKSNFLSKNDKLVGLSLGILKFQKLIRKRVLSDETKIKLSEKAKLTFNNDEARKAHPVLMKNFYKK